jgi:hypothetical protein
MDADFGFRMWDVRCGILGKDLKANLTSAKTTIRKEAHETWNIIRSGCRAW